MTKTIPEIKLGSVLISYLEPGAGHEREFHRWYERDHFYAGCMIGANFFSARRWVATRALKALRFPNPTPITEDISKGSYLASYWILDEHYPEALSWSIAQVHQLHAQQRMEPPRENISTGFFHYDWGVFRDHDGVPAELALEHPYRAMAMTFVDFDDGQFDTHSGNDSEEHDRALQACCEQTIRTSWLNGCCAMTLCLRPLPLPDEVPAYVPRVAPDILNRRRLLLHFFDTDPLQCWQNFSDALSNSLRQNNTARIIYAAPFIPTIPGSDAYVDEL